MFAAIKHFVGNVTVEVKNGLVTVEGVPTHVIQHDITRIWGTSKIEANLFTDVDSYRFVFHEFFCLEVHYAISKLIDDRKTKANRRTLAKILEALEEHTWLANRDKVYPTKLNRTKLELFNYPPLAVQEGFYTSYDQTTQRLNLRGLLLAGAAGSGKTFMALSLAEMLEGDLVVVLCPKNALERVWENNLVHEAFKEAPTYWLCNSGRDYAGEKYLVANYEYLTQLKALLKTLQYKKLILILDESHNFNEMKSMRTELFIELCEDTNCHEIIELSGTPIKALAVEAIPLIRCIDDLFTPDVEAAFKKIFGVSSERASDILNNRLSGLLYKIEKKDLNLIAPIFQEIKVKIPNAKRYELTEVTKAMRAFTAERTAYYASRRAVDEKTFYDAMDVFADNLPRGKQDALRHYWRCFDTVVRCNGDARFCKEEMMVCNRFEAREVLPALPKALREGFKEAKTIVKYVKLKIQGECLGRVVGRLRIEAHIDMADHIDYVGVVESTEKKTVVFTSYVEVIEKLKDYLPGLGLKPLYVYAKTNHQLSSILDQFEKTADDNPLVATFASLSTAVPLIMADTMIMLDAPWRDDQLQQTVSRISRLGATTQTNVYTCVLDTDGRANISSRSFDILKWSQTQVEC